MLFLIKMPPYLGKSQKPTFGARVQIYDGTEEVKIDKDGNCYTGISFDELNTLYANGTIQQNELTPEEAEQAKNGIYILK